MTNPSTNTTIGVCSWSLRPADPADLAERLQQLGVHECQLALVPLINEPDTWADAITVLQEAGVHVASGMLETVGEDYSTLATIRETGGVAADEHWPANLERARRVAEVAAEHDIPLVTFHAGFLPHDAADPRRAILLDRLRAIASIFAEHNIDLAFETGQETADTLLHALDDLDASNVGVNFDPANMILYGMGDPIEALADLLPMVVQVHIKDALPATTPGTWGREVAVGEGAVDWPAFFQLLAGAHRPLAMIIEREAGEQRDADIAQAIRTIAAHFDLQSGTDA